MNFEIIHQYDYTKIICELWRSYFKRFLVTLVQDKIEFTSLMMQYGGGEAIPPNNLFLARTVWRRCCTRETVKLSSIGCSLDRSK